MEAEVWEIKRSTKIIMVAVMVTAIIAEIVACLCLTSVRPAESLVVDYEAAKEYLNQMQLL